MINLFTEAFVRSKLHSRSSRRRTCEFSIIFLPYCELTSLCSANLQDKRRELEDIDEVILTGCESSWENIATSMQENRS